MAVRDARRWAERARACPDSRARADGARPNHTCRLPEPMMPTHPATSFGWTWTTAPSLPMSMRQIRCCARPSAVSAASICPIDGGAAQSPLTERATVGGASRLGTLLTEVLRHGMVSVMSHVPPRRVDRFFVSPARVPTMFFLRGQSGAPALLGCRSALHPKIAKLLGKQGRGSLHQGSRSIGEFVAKPHKRIFGPTPSLARRTPAAHSP